MLAPSVPPVAVIFMRLSRDGCAGASWGRSGARLPYAGIAARMEDRENPNSRHLLAIINAVWPALHHSSPHVLKDNLTKLWLRFDRCQDAADDCREAIAQACAFSLVV